MKNFFILLLFFSFNSFAQTFLIDSLPKQGILLDKNWKWHAGDNPDFVKADFDDSKWESIDPTKDISTMNKLPMNGIGWLRIRLQIAPRLRGQEVNMSIRQAGATEIFLNHTLAFQCGKINSKKQLEKGNLPRYLPSIRLSNDSIQIVAIRYAFSREKLLKFPRPFFEMIVISPDVATNDKVNYESALLQQAILFGVFLILGILQVLLFASSKSQYANLYFGLFLLMQSITHFTNIFDADSLPKSFTVTNVILFYDFIDIVFIIALTFSALFYLTGIYVYFKHPKGKLFFVIAALTLATIPIYISNLFNPAVISLLILGCIVPWSEILRVGIIAVKQKKQGAKLFTFAHAFMLFTFMLTIIDFFFSSINFLGQNGNFIFLLSFLGLAVSISLLLSQEKSATNKLLQKQLIDLETLSQKSIAQEKEKHQILSSQNETLEKQVTERTSALNNSLEKLKATQSQLIQSEKLASLGELTAGIAHEIQNPLNFVNNFSELSVDLIKEIQDERQKTKEERDEVLENELLDDLAQNQEKINHHGKRASSIVKGMLEHSRASTGIKELTDINVLADEYLRLAYHGLRAKDASFNSDFQIDFDKNLPKIAVIPQDIGRVLLNLFNNAFFAVSQRQNLQGLFPDLTGLNAAKVIVSTKKLENTIEISIKDNGTGMSEATKAKIFQPFFTTKPTGQGTGLGLSLAYDIITKGHGGTIECETIEGEGTTFIVKLPLDLDNKV